MGISEKVGVTDKRQPAEPVPVPGCDVCASAYGDREPARTEGRSLTVLSCNGVIAGHPHGRGGRA
ncbi:hypothetical protein CP973_04760 [Streptomyces albofaciens JCM 4342]|uniref:hypothetical protein n=1 Tax=Streptomyces albofaciens TaxID=66866 RepID=UPI000A9A0D92|nr:hypothetical protein [Streptomyces albofaciens]KAA6221372.1 hypothetical protein CP973_04760 [Streptomyces albofaciens JCM 4342]